MERISTYLPMDRRQSLAANRSLPERAEGAALFADVVGFTRLTDKLVGSLGPRRGAEELLQLRNAVYDPLVAQVHHFGGSVAGFNGDGFTCWFFGLVTGLNVKVHPAPWSPLDLTALPVEAVRPFLLPPVYQRLMAGQGEYLAELRPAVALFQRFGGLDFDDERVGIQLDAYVRWVQGVLERYGGHLLQLTSGEKGNYLYASLGALAVHEDDAQRALAAALELQRLPPDLSFITGTQVGISRGRVRAGAYGGQTRQTYGVHGDEVNVAARLMQAAPPGEVRCSQRILQATEEVWAFEALPPVEVKGKTGPLRVYRPLGRRGERGARLGGPLVGRQAETAILARLLKEARAGQRRVLLLGGEAGVGKSRLVAERARPARGQGFGWLGGAGQSVEQGTPYRAGRDLLAGYSALPPQADAAGTLAEQQRRVREHENIASHYERIAACRALRAAHEHAGPADPPSGWPDPDQAASQ